MNLSQPFIDFLVEAGPTPEALAGTIRTLQRVAITPDLRRRYLRAWADRVQVELTRYDYDQVVRSAAPPPPEGAT